MSDTTLTKDRAQYDAWVDAQILRVHSYGNNGFDVWDSSKMRRRGEARADQDAYKGTWRSVRPYVTQEFIWWIEAQGEPRYTFSEWQARAKAERVAESRAVTEWAESAGYCLSELEILHELLARRSELIHLARERGASWGDVTKAAGLSRMQAHTLAKEYRQSVAPIPAPVVEVESGVYEFAF